jgi:hypothetical protein
MLRASAVAICGALLTLAPSARAQATLVEGLRIQGGAIAERRPAPTAPVEDYHIGVTPQLALLFGGPSTRLTLTYSFTGTLHTVYPSEIANVLSLSAAFELSPRTLLVLTGTAAQTTLNTFLLTQPAATAGTTVFPSTSTTLVTTTLTEGLSHQLSPNVVVDEQANVILFTTLAPSPPLDTLSTTLGAGIERIWRDDAIGIGASAGFTTVRALPPAPVQNFLTGTLAPRWRHDWSRSVTSLLSAGASVLLNPDAIEKPPILAPFARGSVAYGIDDTTFDLVVSTGLSPNPLTGQILRAHQASLHGVTPLSLQARMFIGATAGYARGTLIDPVNRANDNDFETVFTDADLVWQATPRLQVYGRYTFIGQVSNTNAVGFNPSFLRDSVLIGIALSSQPVTTGGGRGGKTGISEAQPARLPQRVDRADAPFGAPRDDKKPNDPTAPKSKPPPGIGGSQWYQAPGGQPQDDEKKDD